MNIPNTALKEIYEWAEQNYKQFRANGLGRQYGILQDFNDVPRVIWDIKNQIIKDQQLENALPEPMFQDFCGYITSEGQVHEHKDPNQKNRIHTRFNLMVSKPIKGGNPIIDGKEFEIAEGEVWKCEAGLYKHYCTKVEGVKPRIIISYGFLI